MKIVKPAWVSHEGLPIFSVDIHPDGTRFATGGQGQDCGRVVIWNMQPIVIEEYEDDESIPKMLCQMDNHLGCVNSVRWSMSGKWLASAGDDKTILIWGCAGAESWRCISTLRAHTGDILDLAWAPHDAWLASCSIDNNIIVWNALNFPEIVAVLKGHTGLVKGVTWDPVGKFLASQSDDHSLRVWRTSDWREETKITEPFSECGGTTHVLRLAWSPDGLYLVSAHAMNGGGPTAQIIEREGWKTDKDFVGHRKAVTCVRFSPNILQKSIPHSNKMQQYSCCAIGSRDRSLSIWLTALKRPLVVIKEIFNSSVLDLSWSSSGLKLISCSFDGTVAYIEFNEEEIGKPMSIADKKALHERMYGKSASVPGLASSSLLETPELLNARQGMQSPAKLFPSKTTKTVPVIRGPTDKQIETRTADGKRRITPMFIPATVDSGDSLGVSQQPTFLSSTAESTIVVEKRDETLVPSATQKSQSVTITEKPSQPASTSQQPPPTSVNEKAAASETCETETSSDKDKLMRIKRGRPVTTANNTVVNQIALQKQLPTSASLQSQVQLAEIEEPCLPVIPTEKSIVVRVSGLQNMIFEANNSIVPSPHGALYRLKMRNSADSNLGWESLLGSRIIAVSANASMTLVACEDSTFHVFETSYGRRPIPPIILSAPASKLVANRTYALVVTTRARISVWDIASKTAIVSDESLAPLLIQDNKANVGNCVITDKGAPAVILSNGKAYLFSVAMKTWYILGDVCDPVQQGSVHQSFAIINSISGFSSAPPLCLLQQSCNSRTNLNFTTIGGETAPGCTLSFLERQLAASKALDSGRDYKLWLLALIRFLSHNGLEKRLRLILDELLGPSHSRINFNKVWDPNLMGYSKHDLLREVLSIVANNLALQRLYVEYNDQLEMIASQLQKRNGNTLQKSTTDKKTITINESVKKPSEAIIPTVANKDANENSNQEEMIVDVDPVDNEPIISGDNKNILSDEISNEKTEDHKNDEIKSDEHIFSADTIDVELPETLPVNVSENIAN